MPHHVIQRFQCRRLAPRPLTAPNAQGCLGFEILGFTPMTPVVIMLPVVEGPEGAVHSSRTNSAAWGLPAQCQCLTMPCGSYTCCLCMQLAAGTEKGRTVCNCLRGSRCCLETARPAPYVLSAYRNWTGNVCTYFSTSSAACDCPPSASA